MPGRVHPAQVVQRTCVGDESADFAGFCAVEGREAGQSLHDGVDCLGNQINDRLVVPSLVLYLRGAIWTYDGSIRTTFIIGSGFAVPGYHLVSQYCSQQCLDFEIRVGEASGKKISITTIIFYIFRKKSPFSTRPCGGNHGRSEGADHANVEDELSNVWSESKRNGTVGVQIAIPINIEFEVRYIE